MLTERNALLAAAAPRREASSTSYGGGGSDDHAAHERDDGDDNDSTRHGTIQRRLLLASFNQHTTSIGAVVRYCSIVLTCLALLVALAVLDGDRSSSVAWENIKNGSNEMLGKIQLLGHSRTRQQQHSSSSSSSSAESHHHSTSSYGSFTPIKRCSWVKDRFDEKDAGKTPQQLAEEYAAQGVDANVFYRATANLFWQDFRNYAWDAVLLDPIKEAQGFDTTNRRTRKDKNKKKSIEDGNVNIVPMTMLTQKSTWTWVTGDQHLSNFGAWRNRHGDVVFSVNDFDEAAIFDFQVDIVRIAASIAGHAATSGLSAENVKRAIQTLTDSYIETVLGYLGNDNAELFELTPETTHGKLKEFLIKVRDNNSAKKQLKRFTQFNTTTGQRHLIKGPLNEPDEYTKLQAVAPYYDNLLRSQFTATNFGATLMQVGWNVRLWDDAYFTILDIARRVGIGIGSYGVRRGFVLLHGTDGLLVGDDGDDDNPSEDGTAVILDVKYQPRGAVERVLTPQEEAWYQVMFQNIPAKRVVEAQSRLTSYTDPFIGWLCIEKLANDTGHLDEPRVMCLSVRQRSPWKVSFDLDSLTKPKDFLDFVQQVAVSTATGHVRGTVARPPGDFKHVIATLFGGTEHKQRRRVWGESVAQLAIAYHQQVILDFECFQEVFMNHSVTTIE